MDILEPWSSPKQKAATAPNRPAWRLWRRVSHRPPSNFAAKPAVERQRATAADQNREGNQQQIDRHFHAPVCPEPTDLHMNMECRHKHEAGEQRGDRPR